MTLAPARLFAARWPETFRTVLWRHLPGAVLAGGLLLAAFMLRIGAQPRRVCLFLRLTGRPCLSCGWTRGFIALGAGDWRAALTDCPLTALLFALTALVFAWHAAALLLGVVLERGAWLRLDGRRGRWLLVAAGTLALLNWGYRLAMGFK